MSSRVAYTGIADEPKHGGHIFAADWQDGGFISTWCSCGWRGDEWSVSNPLTDFDRQAAGKAWARHVALSTSIARSVL